MAENAESAALAAVQRQQRAEYLTNYLSGKHPPSLRGPPPTSSSQDSSFPDEFFLSNGNPDMSLPIQLPREESARPLNLLLTLDPCKMTDEEREIVTRHRRKQDAYKTALCDAFRKHGACSYGDTCRFAHSPEELRCPTQPRGRLHPKYKTVLCEKFEREGECRYGSRCQFIHRNAAARYPNPVARNPFEQLQPPRGYDNRSSRFSRMALDLNSSLPLFNSNSAIFSLLHQDANSSTNMGSRQVFANPPRSSNAPDPANPPDYGRTFQHSKIDTQSSIWHDMRKENGENLPPR